MKRLSARLAVSLLLIGTFLVWSPGGLAGQALKAAQSNVAGKVQKVTEDQKLEHDQKQLEAAKKELHDLLDRRLMILRSMADLRLKHVAAVTGGASGRSLETASSVEHKVALDKELSQLNSALQTEIESQRKQISDLGNQMENLTQQIAKAEAAHKSAATKTAAAKNVAASRPGPPNNDTP
jgi:peptidoglycan hydrolase CwlO-like protein